MLYNTVSIIAPAGKAASIVTMKFDEKCNIHDAAGPARHHGTKSSNSTPLLKLESQRTTEPSFVEKMRSMAVYWLRVALFACLAFQVLARSLAGSPTQIIVEEKAPLQNIVRCPAMADMMSITDLQR